MRTGSLVQPWDLRRRGAERAGTQRLFNVTPRAEAGGAAPLLLG